MPRLPTQTDSGVRAAPRIQWRDRAGISPASRAANLTALLDAGAPHHLPANGRRMRSQLLHSSRCSALRRRIVTLAPSLAEDVFAIGACPQLVGISKFSGDVPGASAKVVVGDFASVDSERILALHPDVVVGIASQMRMVAPLQRAGIRIVFSTTTPSTTSSPTSERSGN